MDLTLPIVDHSHIIQLAVYVYQIPLFSYHVYNWFNNKNIFFSDLHNVILYQTTHVCMTLYNSIKNASYACMHGSHCWIPFKLQYQTQLNPISCDRAVIHPPTTISWLSGRKAIAGIITHTIMGLHVCHSGKASILPICQSL